jgi:hypothetical protein
LPHNAGACGKKDCLGKTNPKDKKTFQRNLENKTKEVKILGGNINCLLYLYINTKIKVKTGKLKNF